MGQPTGPVVTLFLAGDVMTGRGIDQILPHPVDPRLWEPTVTDARTYVRLAEAANGPVAYPVDLAWPWGDALSILADQAPDLRLINLETSLTRRGEPAPGKVVHYRMAPEHVGCLTVARPDVCALANNHLLDFGVAGLEDTLRTLHAAGIATAGAGERADEAARPAVVPWRGGRRLVVYAFGLASSGIPPDWAAGPRHPGVWVLPDLSARTAREVVDRVAAQRRPGDLTVASVHWGSNWGYRIPAGQVRFAHHLIDGGLHLVHGHSSHHPRPIEVYRGRLILYGCGDLINDYEGIGGYESYRDDLRLLYFATLRPDSGRLVELRMVPVQAHRLGLRRATPADAAHLASVLEQASRPFSVRVAPGPEQTLTVRGDPDPIGSPISS